jgi:hypothetical protein
MSVINAILFYSKYDKKSYKLKNMVDELNIDIETINVDPKEVRRLLLEDDKYDITEVPTILLLYSSGQHKIYTGSLLDQWFNDLLVNLQKIQSQQAVPQEQYTSVISPANEQQMPPQMPRPPAPSRSNIPQNLESDLELDVAGMGSLSGVQASMVNGHIAREKSQPQSGGPKEVVKQGLSASEIAKQMQEMRDKHDEEIDTNKPFI